MSFCLVVPALLQRPIDAVAVSLDDTSRNTLHPVSNGGLFLLTLEDSKEQGNNNLD